jgi:hypothetical protein
LGTCPSASDPTVAGHVDAPAVDEASGIVASATNPDVFWVHNDSGDSARAFAVRRNGELVATLDLEGVEAVDIEDIAIEDAAPGVSFLYLGDIGDNNSTRSSLAIHRVREPQLSSGLGQQLSASVETMTIVYPDGPHDAETLLFDPTTKDLFVATKTLFGGAAVHRVGPFASGATVTTERVARAPVDFATGGDISRDGRLVAIRGYGRTASLWMREPGETLAVALSRPPCSVPLAAEAQGEAFGFLAHGEGYITVSEGAMPDLHVALFR